MAFLYQCGFGDYATRHFYRFQYYLSTNWRGGGDDYGIQASGASGWLIERIWVQHCDANWLSGSNGIIRNSRVADSWGDGINLNNGNTLNSDKMGLNLTVQNSFVRGAGDDRIAVYSDSGSSGTNSQMDGTKISNNTSVAPWWANGIRIAGEKNVLVTNNLVNSVSANNDLEIVLKSRQALV